MHGLFFHSFLSETYLGLSKKKGKTIIWAKYQETHHTNGEVLNPYIQGRLSWKALPQRKWKSGLKSPPPVLLMVCTYLSPEHTQSGLLPGLLASIQVLNEIYLLTLNYSVIVNW